jgi:hypothetical protein
VQVAEPGQEVRLMDRHPHREKAAYLRRGDYSTGVV